MGSFAFIRGRDAEEEFGCKSIFVDGWVDVCRKDINEPRFEWYRTDDDVWDGVCLV